MILYYKMQQMLWQNAIAVSLKMQQKFITNYSGFLLQNGRVLLKNKTVITKSGDFMTKCDGYYKMRRLLEYVSV